MVIEVQARRRRSTLYSGEIRLLYMMYGLCIHAAGVDVRGLSRKKRRTPGRSLR